MKQLIATEQVKTKIHTIRGVEVILDRDLAAMYQVETKVLNQSVKRNIERFAAKFMFQLSENELEILKSQIVTSSWGGVRKLPYAFTEHGTLMVASILKSKIAIQINQRIIEAFIELRQQISTNPKYELLLEKMKHIESRQDTFELSQRIDATVISQKVQKLSQEVYGISQILDDFQDAHLIIKRPEEGEGKG